MIEDKLVNDYSIRVQFSNWLSFPCLTLLILSVYILFVFTLLFLPHHISSLNSYCIFICFYFYFFISIAKGCGRQPTNYLIVVATVVVVVVVLLNKHLIFKCAAHSIMPRSTSFCWWSTLCIIFCFGAATCRRSFAQV